MFGAFSRSVPSFADIAAKAPVAAGTVAALPASTYSAGVITASANGALGSLDGVAVIVADRVMVRSQATASQNGIYTVTAAGDAGSPWVLTRAIDLDTSSEMIAGVSVLVLSGTLLAGTVWYTTAAWTPTTGDPVWTAQRRQDVQAFTANGTWVRPVGSFTTVTKLLIGGGGGGGSGRRGAAGTNRYGGAGGGSGGVTQTVQAYADMPATEAVHVGAGGAGGAALVTNDTNGNSGSFGDDTWTGVLTSATAFAGGGGGGGGGTNAFPAGGTAGVGTSPGVAGGIGGTLSPASSVPVTATTYPLTGGGGGAAGRNNLDVDGATGGSGANPGRNYGAIQTGIGAVSGTSAAFAGYSDGTLAPGGGGGGGAPSVTANQRVGAAGGAAGGGGGGGVGLGNGTGGNAGGAGAGGLVVYITQ